MKIELLPMAIRAAGKIRVDLLDAVVEAPPARARVRRRVHVRAEDRRARLQRLGRRATTKIVQVWPNCDTWPNTLTENPDKSLKVGP
jgi:hypothetical protein